MFIHTVVVKTEMVILSESDGLSSFSNSVSHSLGPKFIDPNMGDHSDKFIVDCNFDANKIETCIRPKQTTFTSKMDAVDAWKYLIADLATDSKVCYVFLCLSSGVR